MSPESLAAVPTAGFDVVALIACGMALAFWVTDRSSPTSRSLALFLFATGVAVISNAHAASYYGSAPLPLWVHLIGFMEATAFWAGTEWGLRVARTAVAMGVKRSAILAIRLSQLLMLVYALMTALEPQMRADEFLLAFEQGSFGPEFLAFAVPPLLAVLLITFAGLAALRRKPDVAERVRIQAMLVAMPVLSASILLPVEYGPLALALGEVIFLLGALRYHVIQGARGQFMERFLAPQVAELVRERGIKYAMGTRRVHLSVISCDIRGFTAYARTQPPERVIRLLRDFYTAVGVAAAEVGGTIKDLAGDGALVLVGAPVMFEDHAARAMKMAHTMRRDTREILKRHHAELGLGVGVATGDVAVGIAGDGARLEYVAVGPTVNLACRLCDRALDGEIRCDETTLSEAGIAFVGEPEYLPVKGLDEAPATYTM